MDYMMPNMAASTSGADRILVLENAVDPSELFDDNSYYEIIEDMKAEGAKYGNLLNIVIPRPPPPGYPSPPGVGIFIIIRLTTT